MILLDSNVIYNFLFETELTDRAERVMNLEEDFYITFTAWNEVVYVTSRKIAELKFGIKSYRKFREFVAVNGFEFCLKELELLDAMIEDFKIEILSDVQDQVEVRRVMSQYRLLPNDALIAATCKHYGITKIATFDEDFRRVEFLEVVEP